MHLKRVMRVAGALVAGAAIIARCAAPAAPTPAPETPAPEAPTGETIRIGVTFPIIDTFLGSVKDAMEDRAAEIGNVELTVVSAEERADVQLGQVETFLAQGLDAIIIIPVDTEATAPMTQAAVDAGIPLVYVNRRPAGLDAFPGVPYVGSDSLFAGQVMMEELARLAGGQGNVVILIGDPANEAAILRSQGCRDVIAQNPGMTIVREEAGHWYRDRGLAIMETWLAAAVDIDVVCSNNDEMALGAIMALRNAGLLDEVLVGGVDATPDALAAMEAGDLEVTVFQDARSQGADGVDAAVALVNGETVPSYVDVPFLLVTPENMHEFIGRN